MTVIVQVSDPHIGADWNSRDPLAALQAVVAEVPEKQPAMAGGGMPDMGGMM